MSERQLIATMQQVQQLRRGIAEIVKQYEGGGCDAVLADLQALVHGAADEALDAAREPETEGAA